MELTVNVKGTTARATAGPVVIRSVDDLDSCARRLASIIKAWLRQVPLIRGGARAVFDISAEWTAPEPVHTNASASPHRGSAESIQRVTKIARALHAGKRKGKRHGR